MHKMILSINLAREDKSITKVSTTCGYFTCKCLHGISASNHVTTINSHSVCMVCLMLVPSIWRVPSHAIVLICFQQKKRACHNTWQNAQGYQAKRYICNISFHGQLYMLFTHVQGTTICNHLVIKETNEHRY
uniref:Uncharacterized protein n=1 Tax=Oryza brachyantha TaxID=4533 RepID=J3MW38_ORYBR